jgi:DNA polymerase eta
MNWFTKPSSAKKDSNLTPVEATDMLNQTKAIRTETLVKTVDTAEGLCKTAASSVAAAATLPASEEAVLAAGSCESGDEVVCSKCSSRVSPFDLPEHLDYHFAQELEQQQEEAGRGVKTIILPPPGKRKRPLEAREDSAKRKRNSVDISSFFTKK